MIQILSCPNCGRHAELPETASRQVSIACPHCQQQFLLSQLHCDTLQSWQVVDESSLVRVDEAELDASPEQVQPALLTSQAEMASEGQATELSLGFEDQFAADDDFGLVPAAENSVSEISETESPLAEGTTAENAVVAANREADWERLAPLSNRHFQRVRRNARSPLWSVLQVVLGGLAAIPISLILIWYVVGTDVAGAGPAVAQYAPWLVPSRFRPSTTAAVPPQPSKTPPAAGASGFRQFDEQVSPVEAQASTPAAPVVKANGDPADPSLAEDPYTLTAVEADPQDPSTLAIKQVKLAQQGLVIWTQSKPTNVAERRTLALRVYDDLTSLASRMDSLTAEDPALQTVRDLASAIGRSVAKHADVQSLIKQGSTFWLSKHPQAEKLGLALIVEIGNPQQVDGNWLIEPTSAQGIQITIPEVLTNSLQSGQRLLLLGTASTSMSGEQVAYKSDIYGQLPVPSLS